MCLWHFLLFINGIYKKRASREDMAAMASPNAMSPGQGGPPPIADQHTTLMEDPDVWRPT